MRPHQQLRASGDAIKTYFHQLGEQEHLIHRYAFGRQFDGAEASKWRGTPGDRHYLGLRAVSVGDLNAINLAGQSA